MWIFAICPLAGILFAVIRRLYETKIRHLKNGEIMEHNLVWKPFIGYMIIPVLPFAGIFFEITKTGGLSSSGVEFYAYFFISWLIGAAALILEKKFR